jgi:hypothetical protein
MEAGNAKRKEKKGRYGRYSVLTSSNKAGPAIRSCLEVPAMLLLMFSFLFVLLKALPTHLCMRLVGADLKLVCTCLTLP